MAFSAEAFLFELETPVVLAAREQPPVQAKPILAIEDEKTFWEIVVICISDLLTPAC